MVAWQRTTAQMAGTTAGAYIYTTATTAASNAFVFANNDTTTSNWITIDSYQAPARRTRVQNELQDKIARTDYRANPDKFEEHVREAMALKFSDMEISALLGNNRYGIKMLAAWMVDVIRRPECLPVKIVLARNPRWWDLLSKLDNSDNRENLENLETVVRGIIEDGLPWEMLRRIVREQPIALAYWVCAVMRFGVTGRRQ